MYLNMFNEVKEIPERFTNKPQGDFFVCAFGMIYIVHAYISLWINVSFLL